MICTCRDSMALGVVHCADAPCYYPEPKREWVGLTGLEQKELMAMSSRDAVFATEAKLKEKNT